MVISILKKKVKVKMLVFQSCSALRDPKGCSPPGSSVHGILQARNTGVGCPCPPPGYLPGPGIKPGSPELMADSLPSESLMKYYIFVIG